jgi:hypothetical protein
MWIHQLRTEMSRQRQELLENPDLSVTKSNISQDLFGFLNSRKMLPVEMPNSPLKINTSVDNPNFVGTNSSFPVSSSENMISSSQISHVQEPSKSPETVLSMNSTSFSEQKPFHSTQPTQKETQAFQDSEFQFGSIPEHAPPPGWCT